jgi:hypothetical protein
MMVEQTADDGFKIRGMAIKTDEVRLANGRWRFKSRVNAPWVGSAPSDVPNPLSMGVANDHRGPSLA